MDGCFLSIDKARLSINATKAASVQCFDLNPNCTMFHAN